MSEYVEGTPSDIREALGYTEDAANEMLKRLHRHGWVVVQKSKIVAGCGASNKATFEDVWRDRDGQWRYISADPFVDGQLVGHIRPQWVNDAIAKAEAL
jgi:hypothetical protein